MSLNHKSITQKLSNIAQKPHFKPNQEVTYSEALRRCDGALLCDGALTCDGALLCDGAVRCDGSLLCDGAQLWGSHIAFSSTVISNQSAYSVLSFLKTKNAKQSV